MRNYIPQNRFMAVAIEEAIRAVKYGEHPVGAVIVNNNEIVASANNRTHRDIDPTHHAEVVSIRRAARKLNTKRLKGCVLYSTHEPCSMCASAIVLSRLSGVVYGTSIKDIKEYSRKNINWRWRVIDITLEDVIENGDCPVFSINDFMKDECKELFKLIL